MGTYTDEQADATAEEAEDAQDSEVSSTVLGLDGLYQPDAGELDGRAERVLSASPLEERLEL